MSAEGDEEWAVALDARRSPMMSANSWVLLRNFMAARSTSRP